MHRIKSPALLALVLLAAAAGPGLQAQTKPSPQPRGDSAKVRLIREMLEVTQVAEQSLSVMETMASSQREANPNIPPVFWERFIERARERKGELVELLVPVYDTAFSAEDLQTLIAFYRTPAGARLLAAQPQLIRASMEAGEGWGRQLGEEVGRELIAEGVKLD